MANLRDLQVGKLSPSYDTSSTYSSSAAEAAAGMQQLGNTLQQNARQSAIEAANKKKTDDAAALGNSMLTVLSGQESFILDSVENEATRTAVRRAGEDAVAGGATLGPSGQAVLEGAGRVAQIEGYLRETGQMNTLNQIRLLKQQHDLIKERPDLGEDIIRLTNAATADATAILSKDEAATDAERQKVWDDEGTYFKEVLSKANLYNPSDSRAKQRELMFGPDGKSGVQYANAFMQRGRDKLEALKMDDEVAKMQAGSDERVLQARQRKNSLDALDTQENEYMPGKLTGLFDVAIGIASRTGVPPDQRGIQFEEAVAAERADILSTIKDPQMQAAALTQLNDAAGIYGKYARGEAKADGDKQAATQYVTEARLKMYRVPGSKVPALVALTQDTGKTLEEFFGAGRADLALQEGIAADVAFALSEGGFPLDQTSPIRPSQFGADSPRNRTTAPRDGAASPYRDPGQDVRDVPDGQVVQTTGLLMDHVSAIAQATKRDGSTPATRAFAAQAVVSAFTDPVVLGDANNTRQVMYRLADPKVKEAFIDNPRALQAQQAAGKSMQEWFGRVERRIEMDNGKPFDQLIDAQYNRETGTIVYSAKPGATISMSLIPKLNQDVSLALKAYAHLHGSDVTPELTAQFVNGIR